MKLEPLDSKHRAWLMPLLHLDVGQELRWRDIVRPAEGQLLVLAESNNFYAAINYVIDRPLCRLHWLVVPEDIRRRGHGTRALRRLFQIAHDCGCNEMRVVVAESNIGAQLFLRKLDFVCSDPRQRPPKDRDRYEFLRQMVTPRKRGGA